MNIAEKISLVTKAYTTDSIGQRVETRSTTDVFALVESASQSEFFNGGQNGIRPEYKFTVLIQEYSGQDLLTYNGTDYSIYRTYRRNDGRIELHTQRAVLHT